LVHRHYPYSERTRMTRIQSWSFLTIVLFTLVAFDLTGQELPPLGELDDPIAPPAAPPSDVPPKPLFDRAEEKPAEEKAATEETATEENENKAEAEAEAEAEADVGASASMDSEADLLVSPGLNLEGSVGFQHIAAAWGSTPGTYAVSLGGQFAGGNSLIRHNDANSVFHGNLVIQSTFVEYFEANLRLKTSTNVNTFGRPEAMLSQGDLVLGAKGYYPVDTGIFVGGDLSLYFPADFSSPGIGFAGTSVRPRLLASVDFSQVAPDQQIDLQGHFNVGIRVDNTEGLTPDGLELTRIERFAYQISAYNAVELGLGFEYDLPYATPFLAWNLDIPFGADEASVCGRASLLCVTDAGFASFPNRISLGTKFEPVEHLGLHLGADIGLTAEDAYGLPVTLPYNLAFGLTWTIDPTPKIVEVEKIVEQEKIVEKMPAQGFLLAKVVNVEGGDAIQGALIEYPLGEDTAQSTAANGTFRSYGFAPGSEIVVKITHPDFEGQEYKKLIEEEGELAVQISLKPVPKLGSVAGSVVDTKGNPMPNVRVLIRGAKEKYETRTSALGKFESQAREGNYTVSTIANGYLTGGRDISVAANGVEEFSITIRKQPNEVLAKFREDKIELQGKVNFETGSASIRKKSHPILDQVASVLYEHPEVTKVRIEGHTDDAGTADFNLELSQSRADAVKAYLEERGVSGDRMDAKGFGGSRPILPNSSKRNRKINRRVEIVIVQD
jgi:outer membrane protein OmpA-like peptidoglycan-associated protein